MPRIVSPAILCCEPSPPKGSRLPRSKNTCATFWRGATRPIESRRGQGPAKNRAGQPAGAAADTASDVAGPPRNPRAAGRRCWDYPLLARLCDGKQPGRPARAGQRCGLWSFQPGAQFAVTDPNSEDATAVAAEESGDAQIGEPGAATAEPVAPETPSPTTAAAQPPTDTPTDTPTAEQAPVVIPDTPPAATIESTGTDSTPQLATATPQPVAPTDTATLTAVPTNTQPPPTGTPTATPPATSTAASTAASTPASTAASTRPA